MAHLGLRLHATGTRPPRTSKKVQLQRLPSSIPVWVAAASKGGSPVTLDGAALSQHPASWLAELLQGRGKSRGKGPSGQRVPCWGRKERGAHLRARLIVAVRGPHEVGACGGCQRGWGCPELGLRAMPSGRAAQRECGAESQPQPLPLPPVSAGGGLSRSSRSSPHATD